ncbi:hemin ABC transporter substrate-binding protein [Hydrogenophaga sp.]|uniref:heme/hemin ABC transporter substrate-binding protein n=1 Tax=Hydrogenophaga sp. TaxID=1904254 RepID=UPI002726FCC1|nr:ABC transporter substrate-binding protein [Hydrogenophaga sp.]MDO9438983.1 ABC transporter substrate-binding protein [Hydrogenophaga sp.]
MSDPSRRRALQTIAAMAAIVSPLRVWAADAPRLISVGGGITEVVYALGAQDQLVGTDTTSLYPAAALATPKVGYMRQLSAEGLLALRPNALIAGTDAGPPVVLDQLRSAGVRVELINADHTWDELRRKVSAVGRAANREAAARELQARLDARWQAVGARVRSAKGPGPKILFVLSHTGSPMVSGEQTAADSVIRFIGARNALGGFKGYRPMTAEAMAQAAPDVILTTTQGIEAIGGEAAFWQRPELALTPAYARRSAANALVHLDALELLGFGPRLPDVVERLHNRVVRT